MKKVAARRLAGAREAVMEPGWSMALRLVKAIIESDDTRELLLNGAERQIGLGGLDTLTLKGLAEALDIRVSAVYAYFSNREDLISALAARHLAALARLFPDDGLRVPVVVLMEGIRDLTAHFAANPTYMRFALRDLETPGGVAGHAATPPPQHLKRIDQLLNRGHSEGYFRCVYAMDIYRIVVGVTLLNLTWPTQDAFSSALNPREIARIVASVQDVVRRYVCI